MLRSSGWNWSVKLFGTLMITQLFSSIIKVTFSVTCPLKISNMSIAFWSKRRFSSFFLFSTYGNTIFFKRWIALDSLLQWLSMHATSKPAGKLTPFGRQRLVVPLQISCMGRNDPNIVIVKVSVICFFFLFPTSETLEDPFFAWVRFSVQMYGKGVWSKLMMRTSGILC